MTFLIWSHLVLMIWTLHIDFASHPLIDIYIYLHSWYSSHSGPEVLKELMSFHMSVPAIVAGCFNFPLCSLKSQTNAHLLINRWLTEASRTERNIYIVIQCIMRWGANGGSSSLEMAEEHERKGNRVGVKWVKTRCHVSKGINEGGCNVKANKGGYIERNHWGGQMWISINSYF